MDIHLLIEHGKTVLSIILFIVSIIAVLKSIKQAVKANLIEQAIKFIEEAEGETELSGPEKMDLVIGWMKDIVPRLFKVVFTDAVLKAIAQNVFDDMKKYAKKYAEARLNNTEHQSKIVIVSDVEFEKTQQV